MLKNDNRQFSYFMIVVFPPHACVYLKLRVQCFTFFFSLLIYEHQETWEKNESFPSSNVLQIVVQIKQNKRIFFICLCSRFIIAFGLVLMKTWSSSLSWLRGVHATWGVCDLTVGLFQWGSDQTWLIEMDGSHPCMLRSSAPNLTKTDELCYEIISGSSVCLEPLGAMRWRGGLSWVVVFIFLPSDCHQSSSNRLAGPVSPSPVDQWCERFVRDLIDCLLSKPIISQQTNFLKWGRGFKIRLQQKMFI